MPLDLNFFMVSFASSGIDRACGIAEMDAVNRLKVVEEARVKVAEKLKVAEGLFMA